MTQIETRQIGRDSFFLLAQIRIDGDETNYQVKVRNLSATGLMAEGSAPVRRGSLVCVVLRTIGSVEGTVSWTQGRRFGISFFGDIDPKSVRASMRTGPADLSSPRFTRPPLSTHADNLRKI